MARDDIKIDFLNRNKLKNAELFLLKKDASYRQYSRVIKSNGERFILMDAPPSKENIGEFITVGNFLSDVGLSSPKILDYDIKNGFMLLEDFGDNLYSSLLNPATQSDIKIDETSMYEHAIDVLIHLHSLPQKQIKLPYYDDNMLLKEALKFIEFYVSVVNPDLLSKALQEEYRVILKHLISLCKSTNHVVVLKDYHADNLIWLAERDSIKKVGLLDFQDAVWGSPIYDIVSLLEDARRDVSPELADKMIDRYLKAFPNYSQKDFLSTYAILGVQRNLKIIGVFARQASHFRNPKYLLYLPRIWNYINKDLKHPLLFPLKDWLSKTMPHRIKKAK
jgi:N-acetylmuramate 1-kinase